MPDYIITCIKSPQRGVSPEATHTNKGMRLCTRPSRRQMAPLALAMVTVVICPSLEATVLVDSPFIAMPNVEPGHHPRPYYSEYRIADNLTFSEAGDVGGTDNRGNLMWMYAALNLLDSTNVEIRNKVEFGKNGLYAPNSILFFVAPNILVGNVCEPSCWRWYHDTIRHYTKAMVFGLGIQIRIGKGWNVKAIMGETLPPKQAETMRSAANITSTIWVRGELTAQVLRNAGVTNVDPIGCVSQLLHRNPRLGQILAAGFKHVQKIFPKTADGRGCGDDVKFIDALGYNCSRWQSPSSRNCTLPPNNTMAADTYSAEEMDRVQKHCPYTCGSCYGQQLRIAMAFPTHHADGTDPKAKQNQNTLLRAMNTLLAQNKENVVIAQTRFDWKLVWPENRDQIRHFYDVHKWRQFLGGTGSSATGFGHDRPFDFFIGGRIHGSMAAISVGIPTVVIPNDYRILELAEVMRLPIIRELDPTNPGTSVEQFLAPKFDPDAFNAHRAEVAGKLVDYFAKEGVPLNPEIAELASGTTINEQL